MQCKVPMHPFSPSIASVAADSMRGAVAELRTYGKLANGW